MNFFGILIPSLQSSSSLHKNLFSNVSPSGSVFLSNLCNDVNELLPHPFLYFIWSNWTIKDSLLNFLQLEYSSRLASSTNFCIRPLYMFMTRITYITIRVQPWKCIMQHLIHLINFLWFILFMRVKSRCTSWCNFLML